MMEERKKLNPLIPVFWVLTLIFSALCVVMWSGKNKAEGQAAYYKSQYEVLLVENGKIQQAYIDLLKEIEKAEQAYADLIEEKKRAEQAAEKEEERSLRYKKDLEAVVFLMLEGAVLTEDCANLIQSVWHNCIFQINDAETDKYTLNSSGRFYDDFNDALDCLFSDTEYITDARAISKNQADVTNRIRDLKNPPDEWKDAYADLLLFYDSYYDFTELVLHTNCSLNEFKELFKEYDRESIKRYQMMKLYLD